MRIYLQYSKKEVLKVKKFLIVLMALALMVSFGAYQTAYGYSNLIPAIKVDGGWVSVVSYVNTMPVATGATQIHVHATYQVKNPADLKKECTHLDGRRVTTRNDLTTTVLSVAGGGVGTVFPGADTVGSALIAPPVTNDPVSTGFLVLENYSGTTRGADGTLTSEAIIFNLAHGFLYSQRGLSTTHNVISPGGNVTIEAPGCANCNYLQATPRSAGGVTAFGNATVGANSTLTRFMFLPPATATTGAYVIAINRTGTAEGAEDPDSTNLVSANYNARIRLEARMDAAQGYALGVYDRLEDFRSITQFNEIACLAQLPPSQLVGQGIGPFITNGGWVNLAPICKETENNGATFIPCDFDGTGTEVGDAAIIYKVEFAAGYGFAVTPQHQQWFAK